MTGPGLGPDVRARTLAAATAQRAPGASLLRAEPISPAEAYRRQWTELAELLASLRGDDWRRVTSFGVSVHELVAHTVAQQGWVARSLFGAGDFAPPPGTEGDHWGLSRPTIDRLVAAPVAAAVAELHEAAAVVQAAADATPAARWSRGRGVSLGDAFTARVFELWIHTDDVRHSTGRSLVDPDASRLDLLCRLAASFTPLGMAVLGRAHAGRALRLVLTGPGGGTWVLPLALDADGPAEGDADLTVVEDGARFCRIAGKLLDVDAFGGDVDGDATLLADVLAGARAFAE